MSIKIVEHALERECEAAGLDAVVVESVARRLSRAVKDADRLGLRVFGGAGSGTLRLKDLVVAELGGMNWDGGDGATLEGSDGLMRGETCSHDEDVWRPSRAT